MRKHNGLFGLVLLAGIAINGCEQGDSQEQSAGLSQQGLVSGAGEATIVVQSQWSTGYCANVTVSNRGTAPITSWTVGINIPNAQVSNLWNGQYTTSGSQITVKSVSYNGTISVGTSTSFGFCTNATATAPAPTIASIKVVGGGLAGTGGSPGTGGTSSVSSSSTVAGSTALGGASTVGGTSAVSGGTSAASGGAASGGTSSGAGKATLVITSAWLTGYCANITLSNTGTVTSTSWTLVINKPQATITSSWSGTFVSSGDTVTVKPLSFNAAIVANSSVVLGYCASISGTSYSPSVDSFELVLPPAGTGGAPSTGGAPATGGAPSTGGEPATGGAPSTGGEPATGGAPSTGGEPATGGSSALETSTGGNSSVGGNTSVGGTSSTGGTASTGGTTSSPVVAVLTVTSKTDWVDGYCANVDVINDGKAIVTDWTVDVNIPKAKVTNIWNGTQTVSGTLMSVAAMTYNQQIVPGATVNFGFCASTTGAAVDNAPTIADVNATD